MNKKSMLLTMLLGLVCIGLWAQSVENQKDVINIYRKVTSAPSDWSGTYLLVSSSANRAYNGAMNNNLMQTSEVAIDNGVIKNAEGLALLEITKDGSNYVIEVDDKYLSKVKSGSSNTKLQLSGTNGSLSKWNISYSNGVKIQNNDGNQYIFYSSTSPKYFSLQLSSASVHLYKQEVSTDPEIVVSPRAIELVEDEIQTLTATIANSGGATVNWSTSNASVASVSPSTGSTVTVTGGTDGTATITASMTVSGQVYSSTCSVIVSDVVKMGNRSIEICSGTFYDSGGTDDYSNNENYTLVMSPKTSGAKLKVVFTSFKTESTLDQLSIYDGTSTSSELLGTYSGESTMPGTIRATNEAGALTFAFTSDGSTIKSGWAATISCEQTFTQPITAYGNTDKDNYYLIASPVGTVTPTAANGFLNGTYNLYYFDQAQAAEWRTYALDIFDLEPGKGYLYASKNGTTLTFTGTPYSGNGQVTLSKTNGVRFSGWNLVGNPFAQKAYIDRPFYIINPVGRAEIIPAADVERNYVEPMEGIFVIANSDEETLTFTTDEPVISAQAFNVSLFKADIKANTLIDRAIVRFDECHGLPKFQLNPNHTKIYIPQNGTDYAVVYTQAEGELPLNLKVEENGRYTLSVDIEKVSFDYLHLIDNMTGADIDLLAGASTGSAAYTFSAKTTDYASRFKLVFAADTEDDATTGSEAFAYFNGSEWNIANNGDATLQVVDMMGRVLSSEQINGSTTKAINAAQCIYMLRLINGDSVKVQKVVVR